MTEYGLNKMITKARRGKMRTKRRGSLNPSKVKRMRKRGSQSSKNREEPISSAGSGGGAG